MALIFNLCYDIFRLIYTSAQVLWGFFSTPLSSVEGIPQELVDIFGYTPLELMFGAGIGFSLVYGLVKFFFPF